MALAPASTNPLVPADATKAFASGPSSFAIHDHQQGARSHHAPLTHSHSHRRAVLLPLLRRRGTLYSLLGASRTYSANIGGSKRLRSQSLAHDHFVNSPVNALHLSRLSSSVFLVGIDPNEIGLTYAQISFAPGAKAYD